MKFNLYNEIVLEPSDYLALLKSQIENQPHIPIQPNYQTTHGVVIEQIIPKTGIYLIYKTINSKTELLYIGCTINSIHSRLGRYFAAARGTQRFDENHPAGEKHREILNEDFDDMTMKFIHFDFSSLVDVIIEDLELLLINELQPIFNSENYKNFFFEKQLRIIKK